MVLGFPFRDSTVAQTVAAVREWILAPFTSLHTIFTPNPEQLIQAQHDPSFAQALPHASMYLPDGAGIIWASHRGGKEGLTARIPGVEVVAGLLQDPQVLKQKVLIVGGRGYEGKKIGQQSSIHELRTIPFELSSSTEQSIYWLPGYQKIAQPTIEEKNLVESVIKTLRPAVIFVALGAPFQEQWIVANEQLLKQQRVKVAMAVGGSIDILTGKLQRAPQWVRALNLEWFYRLVLQPWRIKRQLRLIEFVMMVLGQR
jgi:N-acetylglucosaminyldiphosphoundecaprenol N-acetyl-beta-D-mannosaminyltransferase